MPGRAASVVRSDRRCFSKLNGKVSSSGAIGSNCVGARSPPRSDRSSGFAGIRW